MRLMRTLREAKDLESLVRTTTRAVVRLTRSRQSTLRLLDETGTRLLLASRTGPKMHRRGSARFTAREGFHGWVIEHAKAAYTNDPTGDVRFKRHKGQKWMPTALAGAPLMGRSGVIGFVGMVRTDRRPYTPDDLELLRLIAAMALPHLENLRLERLAYTDALTLVWNRRALDERFRAAVQGVRETGTPLSMVLLDVDHFKRVNDEHGLDVGDAVLVEMASRMREACRFEDAVYRWGGEEFVLLLPGATQEDALHAAERVRRAIAGRPFETRGGPLSLSASLGVTSLHPDIRRFDAVLRLDQAVKRAKAAGRNRVVEAREVLGELADGTPVFAHTGEDHLAAHPEARMLLPEVLPRIESAPPSGVSVPHEVLFEAPVGVKTCVPTANGDDIVFARRRGRREGWSRFVRGREGVPCRTFVVRLEGLGDGGVLLQTAYVGRVTPPEPWHPMACASAETWERSVAFWSEHALVWDGNVEERPPPREGCPEYWGTRPHGEAR